jgi:hypothetical protein
LRQIFIAAIVAAVVLTACGRVPLGSVPSPSSASTPTVETSPVGEETPTSTPSSAPTTSPKTTPKSTAPTARPSPTYPTLKAVTPTFHAGEVRVTYAQVALSASGGKTPYKWSISSGTLPGGLSLSSPNIGGVPTGAGTFTFGLQVTDALGNKATTSGSINVANYFSGNGICGGTPCTVEQGCVTACGTYAKPVGGVAPFSLKLTGGSVPAGTTLGWPVLTGTFTTATKYSFSVAVTDALGVTSNVSAGYTVVPHIFLRGGSFTSTRYVPLSWSLPYTGGIGTPTATITAGKTKPPPVISATVDSAKSVVILTISTKDPLGTYSFYVTLTDQGVCGPGANCASRAVVSITIQ